MTGKKQIDKSISISLPARFGNVMWLKNLLKIEKRRRKLPQSSLVFVGMHNISQYWWCGMYAVLKSRKNEINFFASYLEDRIKSSILLGGSSKFPQKPTEILAIGNDITQQDLEKINPDVKKSTRQISQKKHRSSPRPHYALPSTGDPMFDGVLTELVLAERYPSYRWNFSYSQYVIVGVPDGITRNFVYEFKATRSRHFFHLNKPIALTQADLYGYFFKRKKKRVQIYVREENTTETIVDFVDTNRAIQTLSRFENSDLGENPRPPLKWKCKQCEFRRRCPISQK